MKISRQCEHFRPHHDENMFYFQLMVSGLNHLLRSDLVQIGGQPNQKIAPCATDAKRQAASSKRQAASMAPGTSAHPQWSIYTCVIMEGTATVKYVHMCMCAPSWYGTGLKSSSSLPIQKVTEMTWVSVRSMWFLRILLGTYLRERERETDR